MTDDACSVIHPMPPEKEGPDGEWEFFVLEDGREYGHSYYIMRAVHPKFGSTIRMWGWIPSEQEIEKFKERTRMEK